MSVDLAQEYARYVQIIREDTEFLSYDPTQRDKLVTDLYSKGGFVPGASLEGLVPDGDYDSYLRQANAIIEELSPPQSPEERVKRLHCASSACLVFVEHKPPLSDSPLQVISQMNKLVNSSDRVKSNPPSTSPSHGSLVTPPLHSGVPKPVTTDEVNQYLSNPDSLVGMQFVHCAPPGGDPDNDDSGTFSVDSYTARMGDECVEREYMVSLESLGGHHLPMHEDEVRYLLTHSFRPV